MKIIIDWGWEREEDWFNTKADRNNRILRGSTNVQITCTVHCRHYRLTGKKGRKSERDRNIRKQSFILLLRILSWLARTDVEMPSNCTVVHCTASCACASSSLDLWILVLLLCLPYSERLSFGGFSHQMEWKGGWLESSQWMKRLEEEKRNEKRQTDERDITKRRKRLNREENDNKGKVHTHNASLSEAIHKEMMIRDKNGVFLSPTHSTINQIDKACSPTLLNGVNVWELSS